MTPRACSVVAPGAQPGKAFLLRVHCTREPPEHAQEVRELFRKPVVTGASELDLQWKAPDIEGLVTFLVHDKQFSEERVRSAIEKINAARGKATQGRMESFFKVCTGMCVDRTPPACCAARVSLVVFATTLRSVAVNVCDRFTCLHTSGKEGGGSLTCVRR